eukprot:9600761-Ditylum_brightwellii.AAC.1
MSDILSGFTNGYSLHHKHTAKQCNIGKIIRCIDKNLKVVRFFVDDIKKDIVVWAKGMNDPHGKFEDLALYPGQYNVRGQR